MGFSSKLVRGSWLCAASMFLACGGESGAVEADGTGGPSGGADASVSTGGGGSCAAGQSEACTCLPTGSSTPVPGTRSCAGGTWGTCTCSASAAPVTVQEECLAGRYEGTFSGLYSSGFAGGFPIPVIAFDFSDKPGLAFTLNRSGDSGDSEFATYTISDGYMEGEADGAFPIKGVITGTLDCKTKRFTGELDGSYSILVPLGINEGTFKGPVTGEYDAATHSFKFGTWDVKEPEEVMLDILSDAGGKGDWSAMYVHP